MGPTRDRAATIPMAAGEGGKLQSGEDAAVLQRCATEPRSAASLRRMTSIKMEADTSGERVGLC